MESSEVHIKIDRRAALVLFDWLADRADESDIALRAALWNLEGALEPALVEIVQPDYKEKVEMAANELRSIAEQ